MRSETITYLLREGFGIPPGYVVMSIDHPRPDADTSDRTGVVPGGNING